jgi:hypothetical protein
MKENYCSRYYFTRLTDDQKTIYNTILSGIKACSPKIKMSLKPINEIAMILNYILLDNPMIFYVSSFNLSKDLYKNKCSFEPNYKYAKHLIKEKTIAIKQYLKVFDCLKGKRDIDKELYIHDYCLSNFSYNNMPDDYAHSILGPVFNKTGVCEGIAKFVKLAFDYLEMKSLVVTGKAKNPARGSAMEDHVWNIVKIDGKTYHLDVTFDMTMKSKANRYDYFNLSDTDIKKDHVIVSEAPVCTTAGGDYFSINSLVARSFTEFENHLEKALKQGKKNIMLKILNTAYTAGIVDKIMKTAQQQYSKIHRHSVMIETAYNESQMVFEINFKMREERQVNE